MQLRVNDEFLALLDDWRLQQPDQPNRTVAIRRLVMNGIAAESRKGKK